ncbi:MAG: nitrite reductase small subunit NirD [Pseudomonadota bacterium]|nr:nitrite reductase small subunit NirD [Pseudomonadota bacterium]
MTFLAKVNDIVPNTGVCSLYNNKHVAVFRTFDDQYFAIDNIDPFSNASVLSRGLIGEHDGTYYIASPIYKQRFDLNTGVCMSDDQVKLTTYQLDIVDDEIFCTGEK